jgi:hypothetical protein
MNIAPSTARQLELTLNALSRSVRKAIRHAEKEAPERSDGPWEVVEHRLYLLKLLMETVKEVAREAEPEAEPVPAPVPEVEPAAEPVPSTPVPTPAPVKPPYPSQDKDSVPMIRQGDKWIYPA